MALPDGPLPPDVEALETRIVSWNYNQNIFPSVIKAEILNAIPRRPPPDFAFHETADTPQDAQSVFRHLEHLRRLTKESVYWNRSEAAWNLLVHAPMLELALSGIPGVTPELM